MLPRIETFAMSRTREVNNSTEKQQQHARNGPTAHGLPQFLDDNGVQLPFAPVGEMGLQLVTAAVIALLLWSRS